MNAQQPKTQEQITHAALDLRTAMKGAGTDERAIIRVAATHNFIEREQINVAFASSTGLDLLKELKRELSGNLELLCMSLFQNRYDLWARAVHESIAGAGTNEKHLIQLVILMGDADTQYVSLSYQKLYGKDMYTEIIDDISNSDWARLLKGWIKGQNVVQMDPMQCADELFIAAKGAGTDEDVFIRIMCNASHESYRAATIAFEQKYKKSLRDIIKREFTGRSEFAFLLAHEYLNNPACAVAYSLYYSMKGAGTDDKMLVYATALFCDYFKANAIRQAYIWGDIVKDIKFDLTGYYETAVLQVWGLE